MVLFNSHIGCLERVWTKGDNVVLSGCGQKEITDFRYKDWDKNMSNNFIPGSYRYLKNMEDIRELEVSYESHRREKTVIYKSVYENGVIYEEMSTPVAADESGQRYYYDEMNRMIRKEELNWNGEVLPEYSYDYSYEYNKETKEFVQTVFQDEILVEIWTELKTDNGYQLIRRFVLKNIRDRIFEVIFNRECLEQFSTDYGGVAGVSYFDLTYDNNRLVSIIRRSVTDEKESYILGYEMTSHDENGNVTEMIVYDYDRNDSTKREARDRYIFFDYDQNGNWQSLTRSVFNMPDVFEQYYRKITYNSEETTN